MGIPGSMSMGKFASKLDAEMHERLMPLLCAGSDLRLRDRMLLLVRIQCDCRLCGIVPTLEPIEPKVWVLAKL